MHIGERQIGLNYARLRDLPCEHPVSSVYSPLLSYDEGWRWDSSPFYPDPARANLKASRSGYPVDDSSGGLCCPDARSLNLAQGLGKFFGELIEGFVPAGLSGIAICASRHAAG
jgi:hypothetical protein